MSLYSWGKNYMKNKIIRDKGIVSEEEWGDILFEKELKVREESEKEKMDKHFNGKSYVKDGIESDF